MRVAIPIAHLTELLYLGKRKPEEVRLFTNEIVDVFQKHGVWGPDELITETGRVCLDPEEDPHFEAKRKAIIKDLSEVMEREQLEALVKLLDENNWDVSFFVDYF